MSDIGLFWNADLGAADLAVEANDLVQDGGLETAVMLSLLTDRRADAGDVLPDGETDRRGWWGDSFPPVGGDKIGSRLWLLARSKETQETVTRAEEYAREALDWLLQDRIADRIDVTAEIVSSGVLGIHVVVYRPQVDPADFRFNLTWENQNGI